MIVLSSYRTIVHLGYNLTKQWRLRRKSTISLRKRFSCCYDEYELIEINLGLGIYKTVILLEHTDCCPHYSFANGWQSNTYFIDGNKLVKIQTGNKTVVTVWEFSENELVMTIKVDNVIAQKYYKRKRLFLRGEM